MCPTFRQLQINLMVEIRVDDRLGKTSVHRIVVCSCLTFLLFHWLFLFHAICPTYGERTQQMCSWFIGIRMQCQREEQTRREWRKTNRANKLIHLFQTAGDIWLFFRKHMDEAVAHSALSDTNYSLLKQLPSHAPMWIYRAFLFPCTQAIHQCSLRAMCTDLVFLSSYCLQFSSFFKIIFDSSDFRGQQGQLFFARNDFFFKSSASLVQQPRHMNKTIIYIKILCNSEPITIQCFLFCL